MHKTRIELIGKSSMSNEQSTNFRYDSFEKKASTDRGILHVLSVRVARPNVRYFKVSATEAKKVLDSSFENSFKKRIEVFRSVNPNLVTNKHDIDMLLSSKLLAGKTTINTT